MFSSPYYSHVLCVSFPPCGPCRIRTTVTNMFHATTTTTTVGRCKWQDCGIGLINGKHQVKWESYRFVVTIYLESYRFVVTHLLLLYACTSQKKNRNSWCDNNVGTCEWEKSLEFAVVIQQTSPCLFCFVLFWIYTTNTLACTI